jgi:phage N-6-adenine-methyltransferase
VNTDLMFSTGKDDWATPPEVFDPLNAEFGFWLDGAANASNHKLPYWWGPGGLVYDALTVKNWRLTGGPIWINPPYSRGLQGRFIAKAACEALEGATVVMLLPARTDTRAFHNCIWDRKQHKPHSWVREVRFLKGRVRFVGAPASAPFPSMIVVFGS